MVSNRRPAPTQVMKALAVQMAAQRSDLDTDTRLHLAEQIAHYATSYGRPRGEVVVSPLPGHRRK